MMKVLFLSVTAGHGHNQAAKVVMECLKDRNVECIMLDTFEYINPILSESIAHGYLISTQFTPTVYGRLYRLAEKREKTDNKLSISNITSSILSKKLVNFLREYQPDVIVCTHIFSAQIVSHLKAKGLTSKIIGIVTDYTIHPFWEETDLDYYVTASSLLNLQIIKKGIAVEKVKPIGIPIHRKFSKKINKTKARELLGIEDKDTVFVMSGSMGYGNVAEMICELDQMELDFQIISVCGNNTTLKKKIDALGVNKKIYNFGFSDNIDIIMDASDCILTKPGGLTVSESLAKCIPMILINPIPGQEDRNAEFLLNNGLALKTTKTFPVDEAIYQLFINQKRREYLMEMMRQVSRPDSSAALAELILEQK